MKNKIIFIVILFISSLEINIKAQDIKDRYLQTKINCIKEEDFVLSCKCLKDFHISINYDSNPNFINFLFKKIKKRYNINVFQGLASNVYMYKRNEKQILLIELLYEYGSNVLVFYYYEDKIYFLKELVFNIPSDMEGSWSYDIIDNKEDILIGIKYAKFGNKINYSTINFSSKKIL